MLRQFRWGRSIRPNFETKYRLSQLRLGMPESRASGADSRRLPRRDRRSLPTNYNEASDEYAPDTERKRNLERLTRVSPEALQYQLTSYDPGKYTAPYTREFIFDATEGKIYEYACHEGNYGMENILRGHRTEERLAQEAGNE